MIAGMSAIHRSAPTFLRRLCLTALLAGGLVGAPAAADGGRETRAVQARIAAAFAGETAVELRWDARVRASAVARAYADSDHAPIWLAGDGTAAGALLGLLRGAVRHGLDPSDYRAAALADWLARLARLDVRARARLELRLTAAFLRYAGDLLHGRPGVRPARFAPPRLDARALLAAVRAARAVDVHLAGLAPPDPGYRGLLRARARLLAIQAAGGWPMLPDGPALALGQSGPRVALLHRRLSAGGDLARYDREPDLFDAELKAAVQRFQARHGLVPDGAVAARTRAALNVSAGARAAQIARVMERLRWHGLAADVLVQVNVPGFRMALLDGGRPVMTARAVVGMPSRPTPVFDDRITHLVFNPTWTVPQSIARKDLLPRIARDPDYLRRTNMAVYAGWRSDAGALHPAAVNWGRVAGRLDSYRLVQAPGPGNPLGRVKFMFPNRHNVYLHDTPDTGLFDHARRAYSSGCVRIDRPMALARALLARTDGWDAQRIARAVASGRTLRARLATPVPVRLVYRTAWIDADGTLQFRPDIYARDAALARRLQARGGDS
jgi:murein L,D-transpeptidase YcbB/YkuD